MREILFRGQVIGTTNWVYGYYAVDWEGSSRVYFKSSNEIIHNPYYYVVPETVGQYTGLLDKNGVKIFEGDVLTSYLGFGKSVTFENGSFMWNKELLGYEYTEDGLNFLNTNRWATVIGNIHSNPELL